MRLDQVYNEISTLMRKIDSEELDLQPNFQRGQIWPLFKKKRLIDSILRDWYVPPVHVVVNDKLDLEEILDGQQRLRAIHEFSNNKFSIDGTLEPDDNKIRRLDGYFYSDLPPRVKSRFDRFVIITVRLRDYKPSEPGELFFRLNQLLSLTSAEQRNALFGPARDQIKELSVLFEERIDEYRLGFTNSRMNFDDVLSRLSLCIEFGGINKKITASQLEQRYRSDQPFSEQVIIKVSNSIRRFTKAVRETNISMKFNKSSVFSWMYFIIDNKWPLEYPYIEDFSTFLAAFEVARTNSRELSNMHGPAKLLARKLSNEAYLLTSIFSNRSASRVNDVSSVILRDVCLIASAAWFGPASFKELQKFKNRAPQLTFIENAYRYSKNHDVEINLEEEAFRVHWGRLK